MGQLLLELITFKPSPVDSTSSHRVCIPPNPSSSLPHPTHSTPTALRPLPSPSCIPSLSTHTTRCVNADICKSPNHNPLICSNIEPLGRVSPSRFLPCTSDPFALAILSLLSVFCHQKLLSSCLPLLNSFYNSADDLLQVIRLLCAKRPKPTGGEAITCLHATVGTALPPIACLSVRVSWWPLL